MCGKSGRLEAAPRTKAQPENKVGGTICPKQGGCAPGELWCRHVLAENVGVAQHLQSSIDDMRHVRSKLSRFEARLASESIRAARHCHASTRSGTSPAKKANCAVPAKNRPSTAQSSGPRRTSDSLSRFDAKRPMTANKALAHERIVTPVMPANSSAARRCSRPRFSGRILQPQDCVHAD